MEEVRATLNSLLEEQATVKREIEACRSRVEIMREMNSMLKEGLAKAAAARGAPGTPSPPATDSRVGSLASDQQMQSAGLQGGTKNVEEAPRMTRKRRMETDAGEEEMHASQNTSSDAAKQVAELIHTMRL
ncbi:hypothetical protein MUK42_37300 [Musa troglodytarum]|uniref:Uncharacterized protein n=1 Tax=Musa troglodytarum TaxID=320322 RepID=A0A9E7EC32_9LILI|nr:hypothetical protein MUK42_37300 [Musa troglodytarum]